MVAAIRIVYALVLSYIILRVVDTLPGLRVDVDTKEEGLEFTDHGEVGHDLQLAAILTPSE